MAEVVNKIERAKLDDLMLESNPLTGHLEAGYREHMRKREEEARKQVKAYVDRGYHLWELTEVVRLADMLSIQAYKNRPVKIEPLQSVHLTPGEFKMRLWQQRSWLMRNLFWRKEMKHGLL